MTPKKREALRMMFGGKCAYCGCDLPERGWHADHVEPCSRKSEIVRDSRGKSVVSEDGRYKYRATGEFWNPEANREDNYYPSCRACNINKSNCDLET